MRTARIPGQFLSREFSKLVQGYSRVDKVFYLSLRMCGMYYVVNLVKERVSTWLSELCCGRPELSPFVAVLLCGCAHRACARAHEVIL